MSDRTKSEARWGRIPRCGRRAGVAPGLLAAAAALATFGCGHPSRQSAPPPKAVPPAPGPIHLRDVTGQTGIAFRHTDGSSGRRYIVETVSAGLALFDYDGDGLIDIYFPNGAPLRGAPVERPPRHALYRNLGGFNFRDVTDEAGVACTGYGLGVTAGDYDDDGHPDLYLNNYGPNVLYRNHGNGKFSDVTGQAGVANGDKVGAGVSFLDVDRDGDLDLYVANYVDFSYDKHVLRTERGYPAYAGPWQFGPVPDTLFRNNGDGTFTDVSTESGVASAAGTGMGMVAADYDNDGDGDVFVVNDASRNFCFQNDGAGRFEEIGVVCGLAYDADGRGLGSMGVDCSDFDNDGRLDFFMTSYSGQMPVLYRNLGSGLFEDVTLTTGAGAGSYPHVKWGTGLVDFDNDGDRDLFIACGHLQDNIQLYDGTTAFEVKNLLLANDGRGKFVNVSDQCGDGLAVELSSRGAAFDDLDNDGDVDVVILNSRARPTILRNMLAASGAKSHWLQLRLEGAKTNRDGVGARVRVVAGDLTQIDEVHSGRGYQSHWGSRLHFGLGPRTRADRIEVRWIGGGVDVLTDVGVDRHLTVTEGRSRTDREGAPDRVEARGAATSAASPPIPVRGR